MCFCNCNFFRQSYHEIGLSILLQGFLGALGVGVPILASHFYFTLQLARFQVNENTIALLSEVTVPYRMLEKEFACRGMKQVCTLQDILVPECISTESWFALRALERSLQALL